MLENEATPLYKTVSKEVDEWITRHPDETFTADRVCKDLEISSREGRKHVTDKLAYLVNKAKKLEKNNNIYRYINTYIEEERWWEADESSFKLTFPSNHQPDDMSYFAFQDMVNIPPKSVIVGAGQTSGGKSVMGRNLLIDNMHVIHCRYMSSETSAASFRRYVNGMKWSNPFNVDGKPVFDFISRTKDFQDIILPDALNIIDWLDVPSGEFYRIGQEILHIKEKLNNGVAIIFIQKDPNKEYGRGHTFSIELATLYMTLDFDRDRNFNWLTIKKAKEWTGNIDPNNKVFGFQITDYGTQFSNIREVKKCRACYGSGKTKGNECMACGGLGWVDSFRVTHKATQPELEETDDTPF